MRKNLCVLKKKKKKESLCVSSSLLGGMISRKWKLFGKKFKFKNQSFKKEYLSTVLDSFPQQSKAIFPNEKAETIDWAEYYFTCLIQCNCNKMHSFNTFFCFIVRSFARSVVFSIYKSFVIYDEVGRVCFMAKQEGCVTFSSIKDKVIVSHFLSEWKRLSLKW